jgi:hypothetical protein
MIKAVIQNYLFILLIVSIAISSTLTIATAQGTAPAKKIASPAKAPMQPLPTEPEIGEARAKGLVWVNPTTKVYHKDGAFFGRTKSGQFMTEVEAKQKYFRPSPEVQKAAAAQKGGLNSEA